MDLGILQSLKVNSPELFEESNPALEAQAHNSTVTEMEVAADREDDGFETVVNKAAKLNAKVVEKTTPSKTPKKSANSTAPDTRVSSGVSIFPLPAGKTNVTFIHQARGTSVEQVGYCNRVDVALVAWRDNKIITIASNLAGKHNTTPRPADEEPEGACSALRNQWVPRSRRFRTPASTKHFPIARTSSGCQETPWRPNPTSDFEAQIVVAGRLKWASLG